MTDFTKDSAIEVLQANNYKYLGFIDAGWGEKFYTWRSPDQAPDTLPIEWRLGEMRRKAYLLDMKRWHELQREKEAVA